MQIDNSHGESMVRVVKDPTVEEADEPTFAKIKNTNFRNGIIEVEVLSRLLPTASPTDRGFIGLAFRINDTNSKFESIYIYVRQMEKLKIRYDGTTPFSTFLIRIINLNV